MVKADRYNTDIIQQEDLNYFTGREKEIKNIFEILHHKESNTKVIHLVGIAGVGKSFLLEKVVLTLKGQEKEVLKFDSKHFTDNPKYYSLSIFELIQLFRPSLKLTNISPIYIVIDHIEENSMLQNWIRSQVLGSLQTNIIFLTAGRFCLLEKWASSPTMQSVTTSIGIAKFDFQTMREYLHKRDITGHHEIYKLWSISQGHPLTLAYSAGALSKNGDFVLQFNVMEEMVQMFLQEVPEDEEFRAILESAVVLRYFNEESLSFVYSDKVTSIQFDRLTKLSFIYPGEYTWQMDPFVRNIMGDYCKKRHPNRFNNISKKCVAYYHNKMTKVKKRKCIIPYITEFLYHLGDSLIESTFFGFIDNKYYLEAVNEENFKEIEDFYKRRKATNGNYSVEYYNRVTEDNYSFQVTNAHNQIENKLIDLRGLKSLGLDLFTIARNKDGEMVGLSIVIPITKNTLSYLKAAPVSRNFFKSVSDKELFVDATENAGYFLRMIDVVNQEEAAVRSYLLYSLIPLLLSGGLIVTSTPLQMYNEILKKLGFHEVEEALHYDYGISSPSPTHVLDVRGNKLIDYLNKLVKSFGAEPAIDVKNTLPLSKREKEVARFILEGYKNVDIANALSISQITVKKHVSSMFKKVGVKNRSQLVRKLLDSNFH